MLSLPQAAALLLVMEKRTQSYKKQIARVKMNHTSYTTVLFLSLLVLAICIFCILQNNKLKVGTS